MDSVLKEHCKFCLKYPYVVDNVSDISEIQYMIDNGEIPIISLVKLGDLTQMSKYLPEYKNIKTDFNNLQKFKIRLKKLKRINED